MAVQVDANALVPSEPADPATSGRIIAAEAATATAPTDPPMIPSDSGMMNTILHAVYSMSDDGFDLNFACMDLRGVQCVPVLR